MARVSSVRGRTALAAMAITAAALLVAGLALVLTLRAALVGELDRAIDARAADITEQVYSANDEILLGVGIDARTFAAVVTADGELLTATDESADGDALVAGSDVLDEPFDARLALTDTEGADNLRAVLLFADFEPLAPEAGESVEVGDEDYFVYTASSLDGVDRTVRIMAIAVAIAVPLLTLLVGGLAWVLTGRALRPVEDIRREVDDITGDDLDRRVPVPPVDDEIGRLATTMNGMLERLDRSQQDQRRFVADASHELRSPLTAMATRIDVAQRHGGPDDWDETIGGLGRDAGRLRELVADLLLLARLDAGGTDAMSDRPAGLVDLDDVVLEAVSSVAQRPGIGVDLAGVSAGLVSGHADQLRRLVVNLVANAVRHAERRVVVTLHQSDDEVVLSVDDDGTGIPADAHEAIFERFVRLDESRSRDGGGTGLGLAICAEITAGHCGAIAVSDSVLGGARFTVTLPPTDPNRSSVPAGS